MCRSPPAIFPTAAPATASSSTSARATPAEMLEVLEVLTPNNGAVCAYPHRKLEGFLTNADTFTPVFHECSQSLLTFHIFAFSLMYLYLKLSPPLYEGHNGKNVRVLIHMFSLKNKAYEKFTASQIKMLVIPFYSRIFLYCIGL